MCEAFIAFQIKSFWLHSTNFLNDIITSQIPDICCYVSQFFFSIRGTGRTPSNMHGWVGAIKHRIEKYKHIDFIDLTNFNSNNGHNMTLFGSLGTINCVHILWPSNLCTIHNHFWHHQKAVQHTFSFRLKEKTDIGRLFME